MRRTPSTLSQALAGLSERPTPALVWRNGPERVELSGRVLVNWVDKTAGLLVDELDVTAGSLITVSPRTHWRLLVITLAALRVGAAVRFTASSHHDAAVHAELEAHLDPSVAADHVLVVADPALAFACEAPVPDPAIDFCAEVRAFPDSYLGIEIPQDRDSALAAAGIDHGELLVRAREAASGLEGGTAYLPLPQGWDDHALLITLGLLFQGGAVLVAASPGDVTESVLAQEQAAELPAP